MRVINQAPAVLPRGQDDIHGGISVARGQESEATAQMPQGHDYKEVGGRVTPGAVAEDDQERRVINFISKFMLHEVGCAFPLHARLFFLLSCMTS